MGQNNYAEWAGLGCVNYRYMSNLSQIFLLVTFKLSSEESAELVKLLAVSNRLWSFITNVMIMRSGRRVMD